MVGLSCDKGTLRNPTRYPICELGTAKALEVRCHYSESARRAATARLKTVQTLRVDITCSDQYLRSKEMNQSLRLHARCTLTVPRCRAAVYLCRSSQQVLRIMTIDLHAMVVAAEEESLARPTAFRRGIDVDKCKNTSVKTIIRMRLIFPQEVSLSAPRLGIKSGTRASMGSQSFRLQGFSSGVFGVDKRNEQIWTLRSI